jgi:hypothetical protein
MHTRPLFLLTLLGLVCGPAPIAQTPAPPNAPSAVDIAGDTIRLRYRGALIFEGRSNNAEALRTARSAVVRTGADAVEQVVAVSARGRSGPIEITGTVAASDEAFACESDRPVRTLPVVRHT